jgi:hypothetical protein
MSEVDSNEIGPKVSSPEASIKRFESRQEFNKSTEGQVVTAARAGEALLKSDQEKETVKVKNAPDVIESRRIFGIKVSDIKKWFKK